MPCARKFARFVAPRLRESLADTPVVLIHGPRQSGKTTLARSVGEPRGYRYYSFDDDVARSAAQMDPVGFVAELPRRAILDEVQRVPVLFSALKTTVDRDRLPGRFLLTGSANVLFVPRLADSPLGGWRSCACIRWRSASWPVGCHVFLRRCSPRASGPLRRSGWDGRSPSASSRAATQRPSLVARRGGGRRGTWITSRRRCSEMCATSPRSARSTRCRGCSRWRRATRPG